MLTDLAACRDHRTESGGSWQTLPETTRATITVSWSRVQGPSGIKDPTLFPTLYPQCPAPRSILDAVPSTLNEIPSYSASSHRSVYSNHRAELQQTCAQSGLGFSCRTGRVCSIFDVETDLSTLRSLSTTLSLVGSACLCFEQDRDHNLCTES